MNEDIVFNPDKFKAMLHYIISQSKDNLDRLLLYELLYFSDFDYYEKYEVPISGETYFRKKMGPEPSHFFEAIGDLINQKKIDETSEFSYSSLAEADIDLLSSNELDVMDDVISRFNEVKQYFSGDIPWRLAENGEAIDYESVFYRDPEYSVREYDE